MHKKMFLQKKKKKEEKRPYRTSLLIKAYSLLKLRMMY